MEGTLMDFAKVTGEWATMLTHVRTTQTFAHSNSLFEVVMTRGSRERYSTHAVTYRAPFSCTSTAWKRQVLRSSTRHMVSSLASFHGVATLPAAFMCWLAPIFSDGTEEKTKLRPLSPSIVVPFTYALESLSLACPSFL